jgi:hypothetical protein
VRVAVIASILVAIGACGSQDLSFDTADSGADAPPSGQGCGGDSDCRLPDLHCDTRSGECVGCVSDTQCTGVVRRVCDWALKVCVECEVDADCMGGTCDPTSHRCVSTCVDSGLCPDGLFCVSGACVDCTNDAYCIGSRSGSKCDTSIGLCVQCLSDDQCPGASLCDRTIGRCVQCISSQGCRSGSACDPEEHVCTPVYGSGGYGPGSDGGMRQP